MTGEHRSQLAFDMQTQQGPNTDDAACGQTDSSGLPPDLRVVMEDARSGDDPRPSLVLPRYPAKRVLDITGTAIDSCKHCLDPIEGQPVLFWHMRIGQNGRPFHSLKLRTMVRNAEQELKHPLNEHPEHGKIGRKVFKVRDDPRITRTGRVLRLTSLDEPPRLWNVLHGEMSLVDPRPKVRAELLRYGGNASRYLAVKPGLTDLWQIKGRNDTTYRRRVAMDRCYVQRQSLSLEDCILAATPAAVLRRIGAY